MNPTPVENSFLGRHAYWILCLLLLPFVLFFVLARPWPAGDGIWQTAAAVRAVSVNPLHPANPLLDLPGYTSSQFTPYTLFWGAVMRWSGLGLFTIITLAALANYLLFVSGLSRFVRRQFDQPLLPVYVLVTMLVVWGTAALQARYYHLAAFLTFTPSAEFFVLGLSFHALAALRIFLDRRAILSAVLYAVFAMLALLSHPLAAAFLFVAAIALLLDSPRELFLFQLVPLVSIGAAFLWPYFDYSAVLFRVPAEGVSPDLAWPESVIVLGAAWLGVPVAIYYAVARRQRFLACGFLLALLVFALSGKLDSVARMRFMIWAAVFMHLALALFFYEHGLFRRRRLTWVLWVMAALVFLPALWFRVADVNRLLGRGEESSFRIHLFESPESRYHFLTTYLGRSDVVLGNSRSAGALIPALTGAKVVAPSADDLLVPGEMAQRRKSVRRFLMEPLSVSARDAILRRYHVTHVLLDSKSLQSCDPSLTSDLSRLAMLVETHNDLSLWRVLSSDPVDPTEPR